MTEDVRKRILEKNQKIIDMVIEKAQNKFPEDIALIGLTGSFSTGDFHEKSDVDLIIVNNTPRGFEISYGFIYDGVGYDIYCTPWEPRIEAESKLESPMVSCLIDLQVLYCAKPEYLEKLNFYRQRALDILAKPIGKECLERAKKSLDIAKQNYAECMLTEDTGAVRYASCGVIYNLINALTGMNNTYITRGIKRYLESVLTYRYLPDNFSEMYMAVISADSIENIRVASAGILKSVITLYDDMYERFVEKTKPTYENLWGTYEELWCNCRNKIINSVESGDKAYLFHAAMGAQNYLDEMTQMCGTPKFDLMRHFDPDNIADFKESFFGVMDMYLEEYNKVGRKVEEFDDLDELYKHFMSK